MNNLEELTPHCHTYTTPPLSQKHLYYYHYLLPPITLDSEPRAEEIKEFGNSTPDLDDTSIKHHRMKL
jgi:hypothetical protein